MIVSGSGTRDSPIAIDDDSEGEVITELFRCPITYLEDSESTPLLSPRRGTFLSAVPPLHLSATSAQSLKKYREDLQQQAQNRKRKRTPTAPEYPDGDVDTADGKPGPSYIAPEVSISGPKHESKRQRKLRNKLERERQAAIEKAKAKIQGKGKQKATLNVTEVSSGNHHVHVSRTPLSALPPVASQQTALTATPAKKPKHDDRLMNDSVTSLKRMPLTAFQGSTSMSTPTTSSAPGSSTSYLHPQSASLPVTRQPPAAPSDHPSLPAAVPNSKHLHPVPHHFNHIPSLPTRPMVPQAPLDLFTGHPMSMMSDIPPPVNVDFDPMFPWAMAMAMGGFPAPSMPMPMSSIPSMPSMHTPMPSTSIAPMKPPPQQPAPQKQSAPRKVSTKASTKSKAPKSKPQSAKPPPQVKPEKPFTLRNADRSSTASTLTPVYIPIGKPDFRNKHGIFPIVPSLMLPVLPPGTSPSSYTPVLGCTLVLEPMPKHACQKNWIEKWCLDACGRLPEQILLGQRRALVEFKEPENAVDAWASRKLGVDEYGYRVLGVGGEGGEDHIIAFWYRPDVEGEKKLLKVWKGARKMLNELTCMWGMKEKDVIKALEERITALEKMTEKEGGEVDDKAVDKDAGKKGKDISTLQPQVTDKRAELQKLAEQTGFKGKLMAMKKKLTEEELAKWEQKEIARMERGIRLAGFPIQRKRKLEVEEEGEIKQDDTRKRQKKDTEEEGVASIITEARPPSAFGTLKAQPVSVFALHQSQRRLSNSSTSTITTASTTFASTSTSAHPPALISSSLPPTLPARPKLMPPPQLSSPTTTTTIVTTTITGKPELRFGQTVWNSPNTGADIYALTTKAKPRQSSAKPVSSASYFPLPSKPVVPSISGSVSSLTGLTMGNPEQLSAAMPPLKVTLPSKPALPPESDRPPTRDAHKEALKSTEQMPSMPSDMSISSCGTVEQSPIVVREDIATTPWKTGRENSAGGLKGPAKGLMNQSPRDSSVPPGASLGIGSSGLSKPVVLPLASSSTPPIPPPRSESLLSQTSSNSSSVSTASPPLPQTPGPGETLEDMDISPVSEDGRPDQTLLSNTITVHQVAAQPSRAASTPILVPVPKPVPPRGISPREIQMLKQVLAKSTEERQKFLDCEFRATRILMDRLMTLTCKKERKKVTDLWKEKIRVIDEVTKSIRNDSKVWYSQETKTWVRMRWPDCPDGDGVLVVTDDED